MTTAYSEDFASGVDPAGWTWTSSLSTSVYVHDYESGLSNDSGVATALRIRQLDLQPAYAFPHMASAAGTFVLPADGTVTYWANLENPNGSTNPLQVNFVNDDTSIGYSDGPGLYGALVPDLATPAGWTRYSVELPAGSYHVQIADQGIVSAEDPPETWVGPSSFEITALRAVYEASLPCNMTVDLDLSAAVFFTDSPQADPGFTGPYGQYSDGVIWPVTDALGGGYDGFPDFYLPGVTTEAKPYRITITFDPSSSHDEGTRQFWVTAVGAGTEQVDYSAGGLMLGSLFNGSANSADSVTFTVTPDAGQNFWFETDHGGAVSAVSVTKLCSVFAPPLRLTNRDDMFGSARRLSGSRSRQGSNRLTGYL